MKDTSKVQYLPFHSVNEFMRDDYRLTILHEVYSNFEKCTVLQKQLITRLFTRGVQIQGFRNSSLAPLPIRVKNSASLFERSPEFAATIMECWSNLHPELKNVMGTVLQEKGWQVLDLSLDRSGLPGFMIDWPKADTFEEIIKSVKTAIPGLEETDDNISLMAVWIGNKLPYNLYAADEENSES